MRGRHASICGPSGPGGSCCRRGYLENWWTCESRMSRSEYRIAETELQGDPAPESGKALARRLRHEGRTGVIYSSVRNRPDGVCVAVFLEGVQAELSVESAAEEWARFAERRGQAS